MSTGRDKTKTVILVTKVPKEGHDGDRATEVIPYYDYYISIGDPYDLDNPPIVVHTILGYDSWGNYVLLPAGVKQEAKEYAENLGKALNLPVRMSGVELKTYKVSASLLIQAVNIAEAREEFLSRLGKGQIEPRIQETAHARID